MTRVWMLVLIDLILVSKPSPYPALKTLRIQQLRVLLVHGHQLMPWASPDAMDALARQHDADIVVTGFVGGPVQSAGSASAPSVSSTDAKYDDGRVAGVHAFEMDGRFFICPGSATGVYHGSLPIGPDAEGDRYALMVILFENFSLFTPFPQATALVRAAGRAGQRRHRVHLPAGPRRGQSGEGRIRQSIGQCLI